MPSWTAPPRFDTIIVSVQNKAHEAGPDAAGEPAQQNQTLDVPPVTGRISKLNIFIRGEFDLC
jgi:hypothetical protein